MRRLPSSPTRSPGPGWSTRRTPVRAELARAAMGPHGVAYEGALERARALAAPGRRRLPGLAGVPGAGPTPGGAGLGGGGGGLPRAGRGAGPAPGGKSPDGARRWATGSDQLNAAVVGGTRGRADLVVLCS